ncbi:MAG: peptidylprolyl isomerase [Bacteroidales bacterium]|nr:peptidylprolyl isomerase [Bacteroidales bacterium]
MAALQYLREKAGVFVAGFIGLALLIFVISDFFGTGRTRRKKERKYYEIGQIAGEKIMYQDYEKRIQSLQEIYKLSGTTNLDEATLENIREQMWQQIIREKILDKHFDELGIGVSSEELDELVFGSNPHPIVTQLFTDQNTGIFNRSLLVNFLKSTETDETAKNYWLFFENEIVTDRTTSKFNNLVTRGLYVTLKQAEFENKVLSRTVDFSYIVRNYNTIPDTAVNVTDKEIKLYYDTHKENYRRTAQRDIEYVIFDITPSEEDYKQAEEWLNQIKPEFAAASDPVQFINTTSDTRHSSIYFSLDEIPDTLKDFVKKENKNEVFGPYFENGSYKLAKLIDVSYRPDSVHARHILISPKSNVTIQRARQMADSLLKVIKSGKSFEAVAREISDDQGSAYNGGDLGWFKEGQMITPFNNACFTSNKGELKIVETNYGVHIIEIVDISPKKKKYDIGIVERKVVPASLTTQKIYNEASRFAGTNNTYEKFNKAVAEGKINKRIATNVTPQQKTLPGLNQPRYLIMSLFQTEPGKIILDPNQQAVFEIDDKYVVAYCTRAVEEGIAPLSEVKNDILYILVRDKKAEKISSELNELVKSGKTLEEIARTTGSQVMEASHINFNSYSVPGAGVEPALIAAATVAPQGKISSPVKGNNGVYLLTVNNVTTTPETDMKLLKERLLLTYRMRGMYEAYEAMKKDANIIDKRYKFY